MCLFKILQINVEHAIHSSYSHTFRKIQILSDPSEEYLESLDLSHNLEIKRKQSIVGSSFRHFFKP